MHEIIQPSKKEIIERISSIKSINLKDSSIEEINELLSLLFTGYKINTPIFNKGFELYRGIIYKSKPRLSELKPKSPR